MNKDDNLNINLIKFNQLLYVAHNFFQLRDMPNAIKHYELALKEPEAQRGKIEIDKYQKDIEKQAIIKTNLGIILFHNCDYKLAQNHLQECLTIIDRKTDFRLALLIKILANLSIIKLILTDYQECKDYNDQAIQIIMGSPAPIKYQLFKELMFIYFRFSSFEAMGDGNFENLEQKYDGQSLACFYSSMGLNRELSNDLNLAYKYHKKALELWKQTKENGFIVITLRRLISVAEALKYDVKDFVTQLQRYMQSDELRGIQPETLFRDCDKKLQCARDITFNLKKVEELLNNQKNQELLSKPIQLQQSDDFWKVAVKIRIRKALELSYSLLPQQPENQVPLTDSIAQLQHTLTLIDQNQPYENYLMNLPFTKESMNMVKQTFQKLIRRCMKIQLEPFFEYLYNTQQQNYVQKPYQQNQFNSQLNAQYNSNPQQNSQYNPQFSQFNSQYNSQFNSQYPQQQKFQSTQNQRLNTDQNYDTQRNLNSQFITQQQPNSQFNTQQQPPLRGSQILNQSILKSNISQGKQGVRFQKLLKVAYSVAFMGDILSKCNKNTNARIDRFFMLGNDNSFRWASKQQYIRDPNKVQYYPVSDIRGIFYGKCTTVLSKQYNKDLEPHLCFSLIMKSRSMDFYCKPEQINPWFHALAEEIRKRNPKAMKSLNPAQQLWRRMELKLFYHLVGKFDIQKKKSQTQVKTRRMTLVKLILMFYRNGEKLPK